MRTFNGDVVAPIAGSFCFCFDRHFLSPYNFLHNYQLLPNAMPHSADGDNARHKKRPHGKLRGRINYSIKMLVCSEKTRVVQVIVVSKYGNIEDTINCPPPPLG
jgi:hypothetical protein